MPKTFRDKLAPSPTKKLLACDGGGIRGMLSLEILGGIETMLRKETGVPDLVLADFFDYVAGTSTGAIIATCISRGMTVDAIKKFYVDSGPAMFTKAGILNRLNTKYQDDPLKKMLQQVLGTEVVNGKERPTTLGSDSLQTLLMLVLRNATTDSPWPISNNPGATFNARSLKDCNLEIPLWQLVRASTAAPTFFPPEVVEVGPTSFIFVDGGVTMFNNPAFQMFLMATVEPYNLEWPTGADKMLIVSVGTGTNPKADKDLTVDQMNLLYTASSVPNALMFAALNEQDFLCRVFGDCLSGREIDCEIGDMIGKRGPAMPKLFTYMRYNAELTEDGLKELELTGIVPKHVQAMDSVQYIGELSKVGQAVVDKHLNPAHFAKFISKAAGAVG